MPKKDQPFVVVTQQAVADFFGVSQPAVSVWFKQGCPVLRGKKYDLAAIAKWAIGKRSIVASVSDDFDGELGEGSSPALEEYRRERAKMAKIQRQQLEESLVRIDAIESGMLSAMVRIREAGAKLQRLYGVDAQTVLDEYIDAAQQVLDSMFSNSEDANDE